MSGARTIVRDRKGNGVTARRRRLLGEYKAQAGRFLV
jgi:hypothetical protein